MGIAVEAVFSTTEKVDFVRRAKIAGYFVRVFFIGTTDPRINAARVAGRVIEGGHPVCVRTRDGKLRKIYGDLPEWIAGAIDGVPRHPEFIDVRAA